MKPITDRIYGRVAVREPVLRRIMATEAMRRLRHVSQSGISGWLGIAPNFSRYEHSVGVMLLLRRLGAPLREQVAGLLHDISHTAFSHVADFVYDDHHGVSYHERMWPAVVARSEIPAIVADAGFDWHDLDADSGEFTLLEQPQPKLCADRVDYFLRTVVPAGLGSDDEVEAALNHLRVHQGEIVVDDLDAARWMAETYLRMDETMWSAPREVALYWVLARAMRLAVERGYLTESDWYGTDRRLLRRLRRLHDPDIRHLLSYLSADTRVLTDWPEHDFQTKTKVRAIDPPVLRDGQAVPLSALDAAFAARRDAYLAARATPMALWVTRPHRAYQDG